MSPADNIDWSATGAMLSGLGSVLGALAVLVAAFVGRASFKDWQKRKRHEFQIECAYELLGWLYDLDRSLSIIRSGIFSAEEKETQIDVVVARHGYFSQSNQDEEQKLLMKIRAERIAIAELTKARFDRFRAHLFHGETMLPRVRAIFRKDVFNCADDLIRMLYELESKITNWCAPYIDDERLQVIQDDIFEGVYELDQFKRRFDDNFQFITAIMHPLVRDIVGR